MSDTHRLSEAQQRVMRWIDGGWYATVGCGYSVMVNDRRVCNIATMEALERLGLVERIGKWEWRKKSDTPNDVGEATLIKDLAGGEQSQ